LLGEQSAHLALTGPDSTGQQPAAVQGTHNGRR
jgi:hypothetical protein